MINIYTQRAINDIQQSESNLLSELYKLDNSCLFYFLFLESDRQGSKRFFFVLKSVEQNNKYQ